MVMRNVRDDAVGRQRPYISPAAAVLLAVALLSLTPSVAHAADSGVVARLDPPQIALGETAELSVTIESTSDVRPGLRPVDGLRFGYVGQSSRMQSVNGEISLSQTFHYQVSAERVGSFSIPAIEVRIEGRLEKSEPLELEVVKASGVAQLQRGRLSPSAPALSTPATSNGRDASQGVPDDVAERLFLRVVVAEEMPYVGELVPIEIEAWFPDGQGVVLESLPRPEGNAFTLENAEEEAERTRQALGGRVYQVLTWRAALSAVKEGRFPLCFAMDARLRVRSARATPRRRTSRLRGLLGADPFADDFFGDDLFADFFAPVREQEVTLKSEVIDLEVRALPAEGRPEGFHGAVGNFEVNAEVSTRRVAVGDPLTLRSAVRGTGNFDRVTAPTLDAPEGWKSYAADGNFEAADGVGLVGEKIFEQVIVPIDDGVDAVPPVVFSFFDPDREEYVTLRTEAIGVVVGGTASRRAHAPGSDSISSVAEIDADDGLVPNHDASTGGASDLSPLPRRPVFLGLVALGALGLAAGVWLTLRRRALETDPARQRRRRADRAVGRALVGLDRAIEADDAPAFFEAARCALQERLGERWACPPEAITLREVETRRPDVPDVAVTVFEACDAVVYAGRATMPGDLPVWRESVCEALHALETDR